MTIKERIGFVMIVICEIILFLILLLALIVLGRFTSWWVSVGIILFITLFALGKYLMDGHLF